ncbi:nucleolar protein 4 [Strigomonas culicis]|uniref:Nucleolar protein 4 n=1 Tax=Strigomonas culicis TaxID=28005 RepID=S9VF17_9TRYP|nr:nucleolar protein 4 [Strigomonas culicis]|eukprot:EPY25606.1 nucleolar protein 4 [Strigomonas culicis]
MGKSVVRKKPTPSALRKKKAQQRIRKQVKRKVDKKKPNWKAAISGAYKGESGRDGSTFKQRLREKKSKQQSATAAATGKPRHPGGADEDDDEMAGFNFTRPEDEVDQEVQSDVDEDKQTRMNERDPLETQLFLKHLPLDTNEEELLSYFHTHFGAPLPGVKAEEKGGKKKKEKLDPSKVRRVLLVRNKMTKTLSGTGFVHCGSVELADRIFTAAQQNAREVAAANRVDLKDKTEGLSHHKAKQLAFKLRGEESAQAERDPFLTLRDTTFTVHRVLTRSDTIEAVGAQQKKKKRTKVAGDDPRNLYLLQEGHIPADSPAAKDLHPRHVQMLQDDYEARRAQLERSTSHFVSRTRLSIRNLPRTMTENDVRRLCAERVRDYLKKHKEDTDKGHWGKYGPIRNVKLLRDTAGMSRGYGFIEFVNHPIALNVLRMLNNNPTVFGDNRRLNVSFSIEDMNAIQKLQRIKELKRQRMTGGDGGGGEEGHPPARRTFSSSGSAPAAGGGSSGGGAKRPRTFIGSGAGKGSRSGGSGGKSGAPLRKKKKH